jgi:hypothetical protein
MGWAAKIATLIFIIVLFLIETSSFHLKIICFVSLKTTPHPLAIAGQNLSRQNVSTFQPLTARTRWANLTRKFPFIQLTAGDPRRCP